jgi:hypothetical protein
MSHASGILCNLKIMLMVIGFTAGVLNAQEKSGELAGKQILIVYEETKFKKDLVKSMTDQLASDSAIVTLIKHSAKAPLLVNPAPFDAIFITNSGVNSKVRPWISEWLNKNTNSAYKILLHTTQISTWSVSAPVDAVTSASVSKNTVKLASEYVANLKGRIKNNNTGLRN